MAFDAFQRCSGVFHDGLLSSNNNIVKFFKVPSPSHCVGPFLSQRERAMAALAQNMKSRKIIINHYIVHCG
jgi:hypothetical protein